MKTLLAIAASIVFLGSAHAAGNLKGGTCYTPSIMPVGVNMICDGLGRVESIDKLYEKGWRVVSSGFIPKPTAVNPSGAYQGFYLIIEKSK